MALTYLDSIVLGIIQGLTEFLPVSSSGHLVLVEELLKVKQPGVSFELVLHIGTLLAVIIYFRARIARLIRALFDTSMKPERAVIAYLIVGTIPAGLIGYLFADFFDRAFSNPVMTSAMLIVTGVLLLTTRFVAARHDQMRLPTAIEMGIGQACAIMPGISRSGTTIVSGILFGVDPSEAAEFSFLLAIPVILGAVVLKAKSIAELNAALLGHYAVGAVVSFLFGLLAVYLLLAIIRKGKLYYFAYYCFAAGALGLYLFL